LSRENRDARRQQHHGVGARREGHHEGEDHQRPNQVNAHVPTLAIFDLAVERLLKCDAKSNDPVVQKLLQFPVIAQASFDWISVQIHHGSNAMRLQHDTHEMCQLV
jgi:hypothetical protein